MVDVIYVVTEAWGASAVAEAFERWDDALAYARHRAANYRAENCSWREEETDHGCELYSFTAKWDPGTDRLGVARRCDIRVWPVRVHTGPHPHVAVFARGGP